MKKLPPYHVITTLANSMLIDGRTISQLNKKMFMKKYTIEDYCKIVNTPIGFKIEIQLRSSWFISPNFFITISPYYSMSINKGYLILLEK